MTNLVEAIEDLAGQLLAGTPTSEAMAAAASFYGVVPALLARKFEETHKVAPAGYVAKQAELAAAHKVADTAAEAAAVKAAARARHEAQVFAEALAIFAPRFAR